MGPRVFPGRSFRPIDDFVSPRSLFPSFISRRERERERLLYRPPGAPFIAARASERGLIRPANQDQDRRKDLPRVHRLASEVPLSHFLSFSLSVLFYTGCLCEAHVACVQCFSVRVGATWNQRCAMRFRRNNFVLLRFVNFCFKLFS